MNLKFLHYAACIALLGGCTAPSVEVPATVAAVAPTSAPVVVATPRPSPTKSLFIGATPTPTPKPKPTVALFKTKPAKGFSESQRRKIFYDLVNCEDRAREEADEKFSPYGTDTIRANLDENDRLTEKFKAEVIADYKLSEAQVDAIQGEGLENQWPPLTPLKSPYHD